MPEEKEEKDPMQGYQIEKLKNTNFSKENIPSTTVPE